MRVHYTVRGADGDTDVVLERPTPDTVRLTAGEEHVELRVSEVGPGEYLLLDGEAVHDLLVVGQPPDLTISGRAGDCTVTLIDEHQVAMAERAGYGAHRADGMIAVRAPMPGKVVKALVAEGDTVREGQGVIVVEAMKMENELRSPADGTVKSLVVSQGESVEAGQDLVILE